MTENPILSPNLVLVPLWSAFRASLCEEGVKGEFGMRMLLLVVSGGGVLGMGPSKVVQRLEIGEEYPSPVSFRALLSSRRRRFLP